MSIIKQIITKFFCLHKWKKIAETEVSTDFGERWFRGTYICEVCGKFKQIKKI